MSLPKMTTAVNNISQLDTRPNAVNGLTADQLKAEFDKGPEAIKKFLNEVLIPALDGAITVDALGAVPETRKVARKALSADILLDASDIDYAANIDGTQVEDVETALGALKNAKSTVTFAVTKNANGTFTAGKTFAQLKAAYDAGKGLLCVYDNGAGTMWLPIGYESESAINFVKYTEVEQGDYQLVWLQVTDKDVWQEFSQHVNAESIAYSGTIDGTAVQDVDAALDALAARETGASEAGDVTCNIKIGDNGAAPFSAQNVAVALEMLSYGMPLNARSDFTASGATSAIGWACRAYGNTNYYAVIEGFYQILVGNEINYVRVFGVRENATRVVQIWRYGQNALPVFEVWTCTAPGAEPERQLLYDVATGDLIAPGQKWSREVPDYRSAEKGQVLMASGSDAKPGWERLPIPTTTAADAGKIITVGADGNYALAELPKYDGGVS